MGREPLGLPAPVSVSPGCPGPPEHPPPHNSASAQQVASMARPAQPLPCNSACFRDIQTASIAGQTWSGQTCSSCGPSPVVPKRCIGVSPRKFEKSMSGRHQLNSTTRRTWERKREGKRPLAQSQSTCVVMNFT
eukprot:1161949-Pelagomonas_calceolata.AAC.9